MIRLTVEEMNLLSIYHEGSKARLMEKYDAALPFMDEDMRAPGRTHLTENLPSNRKRVCGACHFRR